jgi:hypothetical protein
MQRGGSGQEVGSVKGGWQHIFITSPSLAQSYNRGPVGKRALISGAVWVIMNEGQISSLLA